MLSKLLYFCVLFLVVSCGATGDLFLPQDPPVADRAKLQDAVQDKSEVKDKQ